MTDLNPTEQQIRERAYHFWQEAGSPDGGHEEFWQKAAQDLQVSEHSSQAHAPETETVSENTGDDLVEKAGGHYPPAGDSQNFA